MIMRKKSFIDLQLFAAGDNQNEQIRTYVPELHGILESVFAVKSYWSDFFTPLSCLMESVIKTWHLLSRPTM